jgi:hypothetical protein
VVQFIIIIIIIIIMLRSYGIVIRPIRVFVSLRDLCIFFRFSVLLEEFVYVKALLNRGLFDGSLFLSFYLSILMAILLRHLDSVLKDCKWPRVYHTREHYLDTIKRGQGSNLGLLLVY